MIRQNQARLRSGKIPTGFDTLFANLLKRVNRASLDIKVASMAHDLRNYYASRPLEFSNKSLSTQDAIHLASAIIYRAHEFHTFDGAGSASVLVSYRSQATLQAMG